MGNVEVGGELNNFVLEVMKIDNKSSKIQRSF